MRIALIQTIQQENTGRPEIGIGIPYLKSYLLKHEPDIEIDLLVNDDKFGSFDSARYDLVGISSVSFCFDEAKKIAKMVKEKNDIPVIVGGSHISSIPQSIEYEYFDIGVIGEGEQTFLELVRAYKKYSRFTTDIVENIKGLYFIKDGKHYFTGHRDYILPLDNIPNFDKNFLKNTGALPYVVSTRGCPFNCKYCSSQIMWKRKLRFHSADYVLNDILEIQELFPEEHRIIFKDDNFTANKNMLSGLINNLKKIQRGGEVYWFYSCKVHK